MTRIGLLLVIVAAATQSIANIMMRYGIDKVGGFNIDISGLLNVASNIHFVLGVFLYGAASIIWFRVISIQPLSLAYPLLVSISFIIVTILAIILFQESISLKKFLGISLMLLGIWITAQ